MLRESLEGSGNATETEYTMRRQRWFVAQSLLSVGFVIGCQSATPALAQPSPTPVKVPRQSPSADRPAKKSAPAAQDGTPPTGTSARPDPNNLRVEFSTEVLTIPEIGLSVPVPAECGGSKTTEPVPPGQEGTAAPRNMLQILPADMSEAWLVKIRAPHVNNPKLTAEQCADDAYSMFKNNLAAAATQSLGSKPAPSLVLLERVPSDSDPRKQLFGGNERQVEFVRWYAEVQSGDGPLDVVRGLVVAKLADDQFLTYELTTTKREYEGAKRVLEAIVAASTLRKPVEMGADRFGAVQAGMNLKKAMTDADLEAVLLSKPERWFRLFKPSESGRKTDDTEVGYIRFRFEVGQRGMVDRTKAKSEWTALEREPGWIILADIRMLDGTKVVDSQAGYFLRKDRDAEWWSVEMGIRDLKAPRQNPQIFREMGVREGLGVQIETSSSVGESQSIKPMMQGADSYLSRVEALLAPQLMIRAKAQAEYAYYTWVPESAKIRLCRNLLERPADNPSHWKLTTRYGDDGTSQTSYYEDDGTLIRTETAKGTVMEPATYDELLKLWTNKGLPIGSVSTPAK